VRHSHLGLPVRDSERSQRFYATYFGFELESASTYDDGTVIIRDAHGVPVLERDDEREYVGFKCADPDGHRVEVYWEPMS
jgi:predicted lactoylglutathione lyase